MKGTDKSTTFSVLFSDLMMGAMGVIIVLIIFLQVTSIRGMAQSMNDDSINLPPGFREDAATAFAKVRTIVCGDEKDKISLSVHDDTRRYTSLLENGCKLTIYALDNGLGNRVVSLRADSQVSGKIIADVQLSIAGFSTSLKSSVVANSLEKNQALATIDVKQKDVLYAN